MAAIAAFFSSVWLALVIFYSGVAAVLRLLGLALLALIAGKGKAGAIAAVTSSGGLKLVFAALRAFSPVFVLSRVVVKSYANKGTAVVSRSSDVHEVIDREADFEVVYAPRMAVVTNGGNFFLGMQDSPTYARDVSNMRLVIRREDIPGRVVPLVKAKAEAALADVTLRKLDVPQQLSLPVATALVTDYFGLNGASATQLIHWASSMFQYLFIDLADDPKVTAAATVAAAECRAFLDAAVQNRKQHPGPPDDILTRCLALQTAGFPGMTDLDIRNNLIGMVIGAIPTTSSAAVRVLNQLLDRPQALAAAAEAARSNNDAALAAIVFEALRFDPLNPVIFRRATRTTTIARGTCRARTIPEGCMVFASNLSAMFDPLAVASPGEFRAGRPAADYILWGVGLHTCFGGHINSVSIPGLLKPLLARPGLRRTEGAAGKINTGGTPFPVHFWVDFS